MQKALQLMNLQLTHVLSDITGVTGMQIIRAILSGQRDPQVLAAHRDGKCTKSQAEIAKSLEGNYRRKYLFALRQAVELYDFYDQQLRVCDRELETLYAEFDPPTLPENHTTTPPAPRTTKPRKNQAHFDLRLALYRLCGVDLTQIEGIDALTAQVVLSEIGTDMSKWSTVKHFTSWLGLAPNHQVSGGKVKGRSTKKTRNRANTALRRAAQSLARSEGALGVFYRRLKAKHGPAIAIIATAHKLARLIFHLLKYQEDYLPPSAQQYDEQQQARLIRQLQRKASQLGFRLEPIST